MGSRSTISVGRFLEKLQIVKSYKKCILWSRTRAYKHSRPYAASLSIVLKVNIIRPMWHCKDGIQKYFGLTTIESTRGSLCIQHVSTKGVR